eukprot:34008-Amphidinium_carterae.1
MKGTFVGKKLRDKLASGDMVMCFQGSSSDPDVVLEVLFHVGLMMYKPYRPTLQRMARAPIPEGEDHNAIER